MLLSREQFLTLKKRLEELERLFTQQRALAKQKKKSEVEKKGESDRRVENELIAVHLKLGLHYLERYQEESVKRVSRWKDKYYAAAEEHLRIAALEQGIEIANNNAFINLIQLYLEAREYENALKWINLCSEKLSSSSPQKNPLVLLSKLLIELLSQEQLLHTKAAANNASARAEQIIPATAVAIKTSEIMAAFFKTTAEMYLPPMPWCITLLKGHLVNLLLSEQHRAESRSINALVLNLCNFYFIVGENKKVHFWIEHFKTVLNFQDEVSFMFIQDFMASEIAAGNYDAAIKLGETYRVRIYCLHTSEINNAFLSSLSRGAIIDPQVSTSENMHSKQGATRSATHNKDSNETAELKPPTAIIPPLPDPQVSRGNSNLSDISFLSPMKVFRSIAAPITSLFSGIQKQLEPIPELKFKAIPFPSFLEALTILELVINMNKSTEEGIAVDEYRDDFNAFCADEFAGVKYLIEACTPALYLTLLSLIIDKVLRFEDLKNDTGLLGALYFKIAEIQYAYYPYDNQAQRLSDCVENYILAFEHGLYELENDKPVCAKVKTAYVEEQITLCLSALPKLNNPVLAPTPLLSGSAERSKLLVTWYINNRLANDCRPARVEFMAARGDVPADFHIQLAAYDPKRFDSEWLEACKKEFVRVSYPQSRLAVEITEYFDFSFDSEYSFRIFLIDEMRAVISDPAFVHPCDEFLDIMEYAIRNNRREDIKRLFSITDYALINNHLAQLIKIILFYYPQNSRSKIMETFWKLLGSNSIPKNPEAIEDKVLEHFFVAFAQEGNEQGLIDLYSYIAASCKNRLEKFSAPARFMATPSTAPQALEIYRKPIEAIIAEFYMSDVEKNWALNNIRETSIQKVCIAVDKLTKGLHSTACKGVVQQPIVAAQRIKMILRMIKLIYVTHLRNIDSRTELTIELIKKIILNNDIEFLNWLFLTPHSSRKVPHEFFVRFKQQEINYQNPVEKVKHRCVETVIDKELDYQAYRDFYQGYASAEEPDAFIFKSGIKRFIYFMRQQQISLDYTHAAKAVLTSLLQYYWKGRNVYNGREYFAHEMVMLFDVESPLYPEMIDCIFHILENVSDDFVPTVRAVEKRVLERAEALAGDEVATIQSNQMVIDAHQAHKPSPLLAIFQVKPKSSMNIKLCQAYCNDINDLNSYHRLIHDFIQMPLSAEDQFYLLEFILRAEIVTQHVLTNSVHQLLQFEPFFNIFKSYLQKKHYDSAVRMLTVNYYILKKGRSLFNPQIYPDVAPDYFTEEGNLFFSMLKKLSVDDIHRMQMVQPKYFIFWTKKGIQLIDAAFKRSDEDLIKCLTQAHTAERLSSAYQATPPKNYIEHFSHRDFLKWYINADEQQLEQFEKVINNPNHAASFKDLVNRNKITVELMHDILKWPLAPIEANHDSSSVTQLKPK